MNFLGDKWTFVTLYLWYKLVINQHYSNETQQYMNGIIFEVLIHYNLTKK